MSRRRALITGGTAGIGFHVAEALARRGMAVIVTGRDEARGRIAVSSLRARSGNEAIELVVSDASIVRECRALAADVAPHGLDVLVANAGGLVPERHETVEGLERTIALNLVVPIALSRALAPAMKPTGRIVHVVSSALEWWRGADAFADVGARERYVGFDVHARAKLLDLWAMRALARELAPSGVVMTAVNPGSAWTPGVEALTPASVPQWRWIWPLARWIQRRGSPEKAADAIVSAVMPPSAPSRSGLYFDERRERVLPARLSGTEHEARALALADALAAQAVAS